MSLSSLHIEPSPVFCKAAWADAKLIKYANDEAYIDTMNYTLVNADIKKGPFGFKGTPYNNGLQIKPNDYIYNNLAKVNIPVNGGYDMFTAIIGAEGNDSISIRVLDQNNKVLFDESIDKDDVRNIEIDIKDVSVLKLEARCFSGSAVFAGARVVKKGNGRENPYRYASMYFDIESETYMTPNRKYRPSVGRFLSEDTWQGKYTDPLSLNKYTFCYNNPVRFFDPSGLVAIDVEEYYKTYKGAKITYGTGWDDSQAFGGLQYWYITIALGNSSFTVGANDAGKYICDDSMFVNNFGIGTNSIVVYNDATTGNTSIRGAFNISGTGADNTIDGSTYRAQFLAGVQDEWSNSTTSAYAKWILIDANGDFIQDLNEPLNWKSHSQANPKNDTQN